ncbi:hypothetical protein [Gudongella sp. SC589]|jgi:hypothetical protein|uniref:hypothetical protein n=1 Tax=Gudongella sp. SC589 TaxID=3385990 RepID=UPI003904B3B1
MDKKQIYEGVFLPDIIKWGRITNILGLVFAFGPAIVLAVIFKLVPPASAILTGFISIASAVGVLWFVEPMSYFPIVGVAGTYMAFLSGNISNLRIPSAAAAQNVAGVQPGSEEGSIIATIGMSVSVLVNIVILALGVFAGTTILANLPENVVQSLNYLLPSLFGALFVQFALSKPKLAPIALTLGLVFSLLVARGVVPFYTTTLVAVFGTMFIGIALYKKKLI